MNNNDGSYYAALRLGQEREKQLQAKINAENEEKRYTEEKYRSWIQFWIPFIITNLISIAALIVAILAYAKQ